MKNIILKKFSFLPMLIVLLSVSCNQTLNEEMKDPVGELIGKFSEKLIVSDQSGNNYIVYSVFSDDSSVLESYLSSEFSLSPAENKYVQADNVPLTDVEEYGKTDGVTLVIDHIKFDDQYEDGYTVLVKPIRDDLRGWSTSTYVGPVYYKKFRVNRHTGWHRVFVSSWYTDTNNDVTGHLYEENVPNDSNGYVREYTDVYKWVIQIKYRSSSHYSYSFYWN